METSENLVLPGFEQTESELTQSVAAFRAKTSARLDKVQELKAKGLAYGLSTLALLANYDHKSSSWKTSQRCLVEGWTKFSETWPRSGMMRNGTAYQLPPLVRLTDATGSGLLPTPTAQTAGTNGKVKCKKTGKWINGKPSLTTMASKNLWPTPVASDYRDRGGPSTPSVQRRASIGKSIELSMTVDGALNPTWVEWLMGYPIGHTALKD